MPKLYAEHLTFGEEFLDDIVEWCGQNLTPEEVFAGDNKVVLEGWAEIWAGDNGYTK